MKRVYIVVEGQNDASALRRILPPAIKEKCDFVIGDGKSSAISDARTILALSREPLVLVVDADDSDINRVEEQWKTLNQLLQSAASGTPFSVFLAFPNMEYIMAHRGPVNHMPIVKEIVAFVKSVSD